MPPKNEKDEKDQKDEVDVENDVEEDGNDGSGESKDTKKLADVVPKSDYDQLKASFDTLAGEIKKLKGARSKDADADRLKKGEHEKVIAEKTAALEDLEKKLETMGKVVETYQARDTKKAADLFGGLPDDVQERLKPFKDKLEPADWLSLLEAESEMHTGRDEEGGDDVGKNKTPPSTGSVKGKGSKDERQLSDAAKEILGSLMRPVDGTMTKKLHNKKPAKEGINHFASAFTRPVVDFFSDMNKAKAEDMTLANANKRLG